MGLEAGGREDADEKEEETEVKEEKFPICVKA